MSKDRYLLIAPPPTPNGGFHLGHISGPYLGADICKRMLALNDHQAIYVISTDDSQSYVATTAQRLGVEADALVQTARRDFAESIAAYRLSVDLLGQQDLGYVDYVKAGMQRLFEAGHLAWQDTEVLYDKVSQSYPVESYVKGICPTCAASTCGGICEACGHPNNGLDIVDRSSGRFETRVEQRLVFDLEKWRPSLQQVLGQRALRPYLANLVSTLLATPLSPFVMSYKTGRGIDTDALHVAGQQINVWGEMLFGHRYFLQQVGGPLHADDRYVQFFGFDNSYFYVILHTALTLALQETGDAWPVPTAFVTNQFYNLEAEKFSTSKGHLIWANDFSRKHDTNLVRLYMALFGPELQEADFVEHVFERESRKLEGKINKLLSLYNLYRDVPYGPECARLTPLIQPYSFDLERFGNLMISSAARMALNVMDLLIAGIDSGAYELARLVPQFVHNKLTPFCPGLAESVRIVTASGRSTAHPLPLLGAAT